MDKALTKTAEAAKVRRITMHGLRHSAATHLAMTMTREGGRVNEEDLRRFLGHSESTNTIRRYLYLAKTVNTQVPQVFQSVYEAGKNDNSSFGAVPVEEEKNVEPGRWVQ
jgi:integrase